MDHKHPRLAQTGQSSPPVSEIHKLAGLFIPWLWRFRSPLRPRMMEMLLLPWMVTVVVKMMIVVSPLCMLPRSPSVLVGRDDSAQDDVDRFEVRASSGVNVHGPWSWAWHVKPTPPSTMIKTNRNKHVDQRQNIPQQRLKYVWAARLDPTLVCTPPDTSTTTPCFPAQPSPPHGGGVSCAEKPSASVLDSAPSYPW